jgi:DNA-binding beta-propeller fold protein YncE
MTRALVCALLLASAVMAKEHHYLYAASPGIRNYLEYGGMGIVVFDIEDNYKPVRRIPTWDEPEAGKQAENVKGIEADAKRGVIFVSTIKRVGAFDAISGKKLWDREYEGGADRISLSPDGTILYVPSFEGPHWTVVNALNGDVITKVVPNSGAHNTIYAADGSRVYLAGLKSKTLNIADPKTHKVTATVGPFEEVIRPFTVNGSNTLVFVNINLLLGFEIGDVRTGKKLHRVVVEGFEPGPVKRHGCPSHGIAMSPDEKEIWLADGKNNRIHIFDATVMPPKQGMNIQVRDLPGWITFSIDGKTVWSASGEVIDAKTKKVVALLKDEKGRDFQSEKLLEVVIDNGKVTRVGDQFGVGAKRK